MTDVVAPEQQLTRRQLRALRESATAEPISGEGTPVLMKRDLAQTETLPILTRKKMLREQRRPARRATPTHAPRAAVLTALGVATIAAPLTGFVTPEQSAQAIGVQVATSAPLAQSLAAAAAVSQIEGAFPTATALAANPSAAAIALDLSARSQDSTVSACTAIEGASGVREANVQRTSAIYYPMAAGTYRSTSQYGARWGSFHSGTDMAASVGTPMYAVTDGTVVHAGDGIEGSGHGKAHRDGAEGARHQGNQRRGGSGVAADPLERKVQWHRGPLGELGHRPVRGEWAGRVVLVRPHVRQRRVRLRR